MFSLPELEAACSLVHATFPPTPQHAWPLLAQRAGAQVWVKHENHTPTGAFKLRGGLVYLDRLRREKPQIQGIVSATSGNHGQSLAWAGRSAGVAVTIVVPEGNSREKNAAMRGFGATLIEHGRDFEAARDEATRLAILHNLEFVPSFAPALVTGVATYALELFRAVPKLDALYIPIGLGSGICGAIRARDLLGLDTQIIGVQAEGADAYARSLAERRLVSLDRADTRADGIAVRQPDPVAWTIIQAGVERIVTVSDAQLAAAVRAYWSDTHNLVEGAGAAPLAALLKERDAMQGKRVALVASGGNIDLDLFRRWVMTDAR